MSVRDDRINYWIFLGDCFGFRLGMSIVSLSTIMPLLLTTLGASNLVIGLLSTLATAGESLPGTLAAARLRGRPLKKWWLLKVCVVERLFLLSNAVGLMLFARTRPHLAVAWVLTAWTMCTVFSGLCIPAYHSMLARCVAPEQRGGMIGWGGALSGLAGVFAAQAAGVVLVRLPFPQNYAVLFVAAFIILIATILPFAWAREPADAVTAVPAIPRSRSFGSHAFGAVLGNRGYLFAAAALAVMAFALMASAFYSTYAARALGADSVDVARFASVTVGAGVVSFPLLGRVADKHGHKRTLQLAALCFAAAAGAALAVPSLAAVYVSLVLAGAGTSGILVSQNVIWGEFAPTAADVPAYISTSMLLMMPFRALAPALAGWMADTWGFPAMFATALVAGVVALSILHFAVPEPRTMRRAAAAPPTHARSFRTA